MLTVGLHIRGGNCEQILRGCDSPYLPVLAVEVNASHSRSGHPLREEVDVCLARLWVSELEIVEPMFTSTEAAKWTHGAMALGYA